MDNFLTKCNFLTKTIFCSITSKRSALMGFSMIMVFLFHARSEKLGFMPTGLPGIIINNGCLGVDVFFFLSAFGLCYSLKKNSIKQFFVNRFNRIIPTWWLVLLFVHFIGITIGSRFQDDSFVYPHTIADMFFWYTGLGYFFNMCSYEWYIPTLLLFYSLMPVLFRLSRNYLLLIVILLIPIIIFFENGGIYPHLSHSITRIPIFIIGVLFFKDSEKNNYIQFLVTLFFIYLYSYAFTDLWDVPVTILFASICPLLIGILSIILSCKGVKIFSLFLSFIGSISLEFYLIHLFRRPQYIISYVSQNTYVQIIGAFILCIFLSCFLHRLLTIFKKYYLSPRSI